MNINVDGYEYGYVVTDAACSFPHLVILSETYIAYSERVFIC